MAVAMAVGMAVAMAVGMAVAMAVGMAVAMVVGMAVAMAVGMTVAMAVGMADGSGVGMGVMVIAATPRCSCSVPSIGSAVGESAPLNTATATHASAHTATGPPAPASAGYTRVTGTVWEPPAAAHTSTVADGSTTSPSYQSGAAGTTSPPTPTHRRRAPARVWNNSTHVAATR